jgi:hypothetical protein
MSVPGETGRIFHSRRELMKKVVMAVLAAALMAGLGTTGAFAQEKKVEFSLNAGVMTFYGGDLTFSGLGLTAGPQVDIHVAKGFMISPEFMLVTDTHFSGLAGLPGLTLNFVGRGFFIGGGAVLPISISDGLGVAELLPKVHLGYHGRKVNLSVYTITAFNAIFRYGVVGASLGYRF